MWRIRILGVLLVGTAGCAQLAGIDETSGVPSGVSLSFDRLSIGTTVVRGPLDLTADPVTYLVADDAAADGLTRVPAEQVAINTWAAPIYEGTPAAMFTLPGRPDPRIWAFPSRDQIGVDAVYEHPDPLPAPEGATLSVSATLPTAYNGTETFQLFSVGTWTLMALPAPVTIGDLAVGPFEYDYSTSTSLVGRSPEAFTVDDTHLVLRHDADTLTGLLEVTPFEQTGADTISGSMVEVTRDQTLDVILDPPGTPSRFAGALPAMTTFTMSWIVRASPGYGFSAELGPTLASGALDMTSMAPLAVTYGNPFLARDWASTFTFTATASRTYTVPSLMLDITLVGAIGQVIDARDAAPGTVIDLPVGVPEGITIDGVALTTDGLTIPKPVVSPTVTFTPSRPDNTIYEIQLLEIAPNLDSTALERRVLITIDGTAPTFVIPAELLEAGKMYTIRAEVVAGGYLTAAAGDLSNRPLPMSRALFESGLFTVTP